VDFIGRAMELSTLKREYRRKSGFVVIYGRRRVGKTTLIKEFINSQILLPLVNGQPLPAASAPCHSKRPSPPSPIPVRSLLLLPVPPKSRLTLRQPGPVK
jgi:hypothetical protein